MSADFDAFLYIKKGNEIIGFDDDGGEGLNARYFFRPTESGEYEVWATTYATLATGEFTVQIRELSEK
jgi:hypothetical protein